MQKSQVHETSICACAAVTNATALSCQPIYIFYHSVHANPSSYRLKDTSAYGISAYLTELVENTLHGLQECDFIELHPTEDDTDENAEEIITSLSACAISSHHNTSCIP